MLKVFRFSVGFAIFFALLPVGAKECPTGTRNNYKGECLSSTPVADDVSSQEKQRKKWVEPTTSVVEVEIVEVEIVEVERVDIKEAVPVDAAGEKPILAAAVEEESPASGSISSGSHVETTMSSGANTGDLRSASSTIRQLRDEIQDLLNRVELQRYELEKLRGRQMDLYDDLDQRMREQERLILVVPSPIMPSVDTISVMSEEVDISGEPTPMVAGNNNAQPEILEESVGEISALMETKNTNTVLVLEPTPMVAGNNNAQPEILEESVGEIGTGMTITNELPEVAPVIESHSSLFGSVLFTSSVNSGAEIIELATADSVNQRERIPDEVIGLTNGGDISSSINSMVASVIGLVKEKPILNVVDLSEVGSPDNERDLGENIDSQKESVRDDSADDVLREKAPAAIVGVGLSVASSQEQTQLIVPGSEVDTVTLSEQKAYDQAFNMLKQSRYDDAAGEFAKFLRKHAGSHLTDDAWYWMAEAHYVTRDFEQALIAFNTVTSYFVNSPRIPASRLKIGYIQYEIADYRESRETLTKLLRDFPAHRVAVSAEARLKKMDREER